MTIFVQGAGWRHEATWPVDSTDRTYHLDVRGALSVDAPIEADEVAHRGDPTIGTTAGLFDPAGTGLGVPADQGVDDLRSMTFTSAPSAVDLEITGTPTATLRIAIDEGDDVNVVVKLTDVSADGGSILITTGWLKAGHRQSHELTEPIPVGQFITLTVPLVSTSYLLRAGQRLRVSVSCSDFPRLFPTRNIPSVRLACGHAGSSIDVPVSASEGVPGPRLPEPDPAEERNALSIESVPRYRIEHDYVADTVTVISGQHTSLMTPMRDGRLELDRTSRSIVSRTEPGSARVEGEAILTARTSGGNTVVAEGRAWITNSGQTFAGRVAVDGLVVFEKQWSR